MDIERDSTFYILYGGCPQLSPSYFLLKWEKVDTKVSVYCISENSGNDEGPTVIEVTDVGSATPVPANGEVKLSVGDYFLSVWEQNNTGPTPPDEEPKYSELVRVR